MRNEHYSPDQLRLLLDDESTQDMPFVNVADDIDDDPLNQSGPKPKKRGRRKLPDHLPRVEIEHTLDEQACQGVMEPLSQKITEQLDIIAAQVRVIRHLRQTYRCPECEDALVTVPMPPQPIPNDNATAATLAFLISAKY